MITDELKALVRDEAAKLRQHATSDELSELSIKLLDANSTRHCIYGMLTGDCSNRRATCLMRLCAIPYSTNTKRKEQPVDGTFDYRCSLKGIDVFTAIECYISQPEAKNAELIAYLRGETDNLEL